MSISGINPFSSPVGGAALANSAKVAKADGAKSVEEQFLDYAQMTPAERLRAAILKDMKLSEEELDKMDPEAREKIEKEIAERIKEKVEESSEKKTGMIMDVSV